MSENLNRSGPFERVQKPHQWPQGQRWFIHAGLVVWPLVRISCLRRSDWMYWDALTGKFHLSTYLGMMIISSGFFIEIS